MRRAILCALLAALVASAGAAAAHRSPYAKRLAALCTDTRKRIEKVPMPRDSKDLTSTTARVDVIGVGFVKKLAKLRPAPRERARAVQLQRLYAAYWGGQVQAYAFLQQGIERNKPDFLNLYTRSLSALDDYQTRAEQLATKLGAHECARQPVRK